MMQSLFLIMAYGTWNGDLGFFHDALAFQSRLAQVGHPPHDVSTRLTAFQITRSLIGPTADEMDNLGHQVLSWEGWVRLETLKR